MKSPLPAGTEIPAYTNVAEHPYKTIQPPMHKRKGKRLNPKPRKDSRRPNTDVSGSGRVAVAGATVTRSVARHPEAVQTKAGAAGAAVGQHIGDASVGGWSVWAGPQ